MLAGLFRSDELDSYTAYPREDCGCSSKDCTAERAEVFFPRRFVPQSMALVSWRTRSRHQLNVANAGHWGVTIIRA